MTTPSPERAARLAQAAAAHEQFIRTYLPLAVYDPARAAGHGPDYNLYYLDLDPPPGAEAMYQALLAGEAG
jgi:hypothetical protein